MRTSVQIKIIDILHCLPGCIFHVNCTPEICQFILQLFSHFRKSTPEISTVEYMECKLDCLLLDQCIALTKQQTHYYTE